MQNNDAALVHRALAGDDTAFTILMERYQKQVHATVWRTIKDFHIAEDIVQETFLKAHQKLGTLKEPDRFSAWLNAIATRRFSLIVTNLFVLTRGYEDRLQSYQIAVRENEDRIKRVERYSEFG